jgi:hypothetical protein
MDVLTRQFSRLLHLAVIAPLFALGCGDSGPPRYRISGTVSYEGKPVPFGAIIFQPNTMEKNGGPNGVAEIIDGAFDTRVSGQGFSGGPQIVIVQAFDGTNIHPDYNPYGLSLGSSYNEPHDLPNGEAVLNIELTERKRRHK